jgi:hypothetical protein
MPKTIKITHKYNRTNINTDNFQVQRQKYAFNHGEHLISCKSTKQKEREDILLE